MQKTAATFALLTLAACAGPADGPLPQGAMPFNQVLSSNAAKPFECIDYDPASRTCGAYGTYDQRADGSYVSTSFFLIEESPRVVVRGVAPAVDFNGRGCTDGGAIQLDVVEGQTDASTEFMLGFIEAFYADIGRACAVYYPDGSGFRTVLSVPGNGVMDGYEARSTFFAQMPRLRVDL